MVKEVQSVHSQRIRLMMNPWPDTIPDGRLMEILTRVAIERSESLRQRFEVGLYTRDSMAITLLDPSAPLWRPSSDTVLAIIELGSEGRRFGPNALAKAIQHRNSGLLAGTGVYVDPALTSDGDFAYGFSGRVDCLHHGGSGLSEFQDAYESGHAAVTFLYEIRTARRSWRDDNRSHSWLSTDNRPSGFYLELAARAALLTSETPPTDAVSSRLG